MHNGQPLLSAEEQAILLVSASRRVSFLTDAEALGLLTWAEDVMLNQVLLELVLQGAADVRWDSIRGEPVFYPHQG